MDHRKEEDSSYWIWASSIAGTVFGDQKSFRMTSWPGLSGCQTSFLGESTGLKHLTVTLKWWVPTKGRTKSTPRLQNNILGMLHFNWIFVSKFHPFFLGKYIKNLDLGVNSMVLVGISFHFLPDSQISPKCTFWNVIQCASKTKALFHLSPSPPFPTKNKTHIMPPFF